jgi:hypothetical protein
MNYYAQGGQAYGLKSIAQELQDMGRGGDTILAHINPQEAAMLKRMGGSGTINPQTGLPEYFVKSVVKVVSAPVKAVANVAGDILKGAEKAIVRPIGDLVKPILPYVQYVAPFIPGVGPLAAAGLGALGSGFAGGGGFNFKRGLMGGMTAYGLSNLYAGMQAAGGAGGTAVPGAEVASTNVAPVEVAATGAETTSSGLAAGDAGASVGNVGGTGGATGYSGYANPNMGPPSSAMTYADQAANVVNSGVDAVKAGYNTMTDPSTYTNLGEKFATNMGDAGQGLKNLVGVGDATMTSADAAKAFGTKFGTGSAMGIYGGITGAKALDEMEKAKLEERLANAKSQEEYDAIMAEINAAYDRGIAAVEANPYQFAKGGDVPTGDSQIQKMRDIGIRDEILANTDKEKLQGYYTDLFGSGDNRGLSNAFMFRKMIPQMESLSTKVPAPSPDTRSALVAMINNPYQFNEGGDVDGQAGIDDFNQYMNNGVASMAKGGTAPRFLSGGGDGMSDSIKATINGNQPARLADGEFVIPADVVSHLGNGSSKAGAKQLYSMMDKVRSARTGNKKQGKQINPAKFMPA